MEEQQTVSLRKPVRQPEPPSQASQSTPQLSPVYRPITPWGYVGYSLLYSIPIVGFILLIIFSLDGSNINRRNHARSYWCALLLTLLIVLIISAIIVAALATGVGVSDINSLIRIVEKTIR